MKKILLTLAAIPAATFAIEASAQTNANAGGAVAIETRIANLEARFDAAMRAGVLTREEQLAISTQLSQLRSLERQYARNGLTSRERRTLQQRIRNVRDQLRSSAGNAWARNYGWSDRDLDVYVPAYGATGYTYDAYGRRVPVQTQGQAYTYDAYGRRVPVQTQTQGYTYDAYGRRVPVPTVTYDAYGRAIPNTGYYGQGGPYEPVYNPPSNNSGIGNILSGVLGSVLGGGNSGAGGILGSILGNGGLRPGDIITSVIGNALSRGNDYGYQDRGDVYFRTDGQRVYEIDARTNRVIRIHPVR